jgi:hypothetical protein
MHLPYCWHSLQGVRGRAAPPGGEREGQRPLAKKE